jgi:sterol 3beta-glucosyltransferase
MRWPRVARNSVETDLDVARKDSNDNATQDASSSYDQLTLKSANPTGLSRMFSDAALYEKVLTACPETLKNGVFHFSADDESLPNCLGGFNQLIGRDLDDAERVVTGKLATLSVNTWAASTIDDPFGADTPSEEERGEISSSDEGEDKKQAPLSAAPTPSDSEEPPSEPKLTPEEVVELFELEFGALAAPGEEKLLLETDAALLRDVIVLVGPPPPPVPLLIHRRFTFSRYCSGRCSPHYTSIHVSCFSLINPAG